jgi:hypothetical protein
MVHSALDKSMAWFFAMAVAIGTLGGIYRCIQMDEDWGLAVVLVLFCTPACSVALLYLRRQRNRVILTNTGLTWKRGSVAVFMPWSDVTGFSEALTAWIIRDRNGRTLRIDKLLVGTPTTFLDYLRPACHRTCTNWLLPIFGLGLRFAHACGFGFLLTRTLNPRQRDSEPEPQLRGSGTRCVSRPSSR